MENDFEEGKESYLGQRIHQGHSTRLVVILVILSNVITLMLGTRFFQWLSTPSGVHTAADNRERALPSVVLDYTIADTVVSTDLKHRRIAAYNHLHRPQVRAE